MHLNTIAAVILSGAKDPSGRPRPFPWILAQLTPAPSHRMKVKKYPTLSHRHPGRSEESAESALVRPLPLGSFAPLRMTVAGMFCTPQISSPSTTQPHSGCSRLSRVHAVGMQFRRVRGRTVTLSGRGSSTPSVPAARKGCGRAAPLHPTASFRLRMTVAGIFGTLQRLSPVTMQPPAVAPVPQEDGSGSLAPSHALCAHLRAAQVALGRPGATGRIKRGEPTISCRRSGARRGRSRCRRGNNRRGRRGRPRAGRASRVPGRCGGNASTSEFGARR